MSKAKRYFYGLGQRERAWDPDGVALSALGLSRRFVRACGVLPTWCLAAFRAGYLGLDPRG